MTPHALLLGFLLLVRGVLALPYHDHDHHVSSGLPDTWHHPPEHPVHQLFRRAPPGDGFTYPSVGSPEWRAGFPTGAPDPSQLPQAWISALNSAVKAGKIPNIPPSTNTVGNNPTYPPGLNPGGPDICSATYKCRAPSDIWDAPTGVLGTGFDDGPFPTSTRLLQFLQAQNLRVTHFMIGVNILGFPDQFNQAFSTNGDDIAVHTYSHPYMTTLDNLGVLGQLGWTMQLIHNSTGGRVPRYWRPPYGDTDNRVRAIAKEVFGLTAILWNQDSSDWTMQTPDQAAAIRGNFQNWLTGPKTPGLIILEHEINDLMVNLFMDVLPMMQSNGWNLTSVAQIGAPGSAYINANGQGPVTLAGVLGAQPTPVATTSSLPPTPVSSTSPPSSTAKKSSAISSRHARWWSWGIPLLLGCVSLRMTP